MAKRAVKIVLTSEEVRLLLIKHLQLDESKTSYPTAVLNGDFKSSNFTIDLSYEEDVDRPWENK